MLCVFFDEAIKDVERLARGNSGSHSNYKRLVKWRCTVLNVPQWCTAINTRSDCAEARRTHPLDTIRTLDLASLGVKGITTIRRGEFCYHIILCITQNVRDE